MEVVGDLIDEPNEGFSLALSNALNASISRPVARATIVDDDDAPSVSIGDVSLVEGQSGTKTVRLYADPVAGQWVLDAGEV